MEDFVLIVLSIAVVWLAVKLSSISQDVPNLIELRDLITRLEQRITLLERARALHLKLPFSPQPRNNRKPSQPPSSPYQNPP